MICVDSQRQDFGVLVDDFSDGGHNYGVFHGVDVEVDILVVVDILVIFVAVGFVT